MPPVLRGVALLTLPAAVLAGAFLFVFYSAALPRPLSGLEIHAPYLAFAIGAVLAVTFKRGRVLAALVVLLIAYVAQQLWLQAGVDSLRARDVDALARALGGAAVVINCLP